MYIVSILMQIFFVTFVHLLNRRDYPSISVQLFPMNVLIYFIVIYGDPSLFPPFMVEDFFLTILDDCSRCTWVYLLKHKSQTTSYLDQFCTMVETQFARKVKCIRSDNGTEFFLKDLFTKKGILHQLSCVETPQQNAVVERKHQHILNVARALKFQSNLPLHLWGYCILTTVYLINKLPSSILNQKILHEVLFSHPPTYSH